MSLPIPVPMAVAIYFTTWWIVLFAVLPFGVRSQEESREVVPGTDPGAPMLPRLAVKALWTTGLSALVFVAILAMFSYL